tara:strand:- start:182 stop:1459 length:1278 start_codon:yes stop_codon:yes gene_type:complete
MSNYNFFERSLSRFLKSFPYIHLKAKKGYQNLNYFFSRLSFSSLKHFELYSNLSIDNLIVNENDESHVFFGYYDHSPWSPNMNYLILNTVNKNKLTLKLFERANGSYLFKKNILETPVFNFQQGIRAIWINNNEIIFNCIQKKQLISSIYNIENDSERYLSFPIQEMQNNNAFSINYHHLDRINKDYGYDLLSRGYFMADIDGIIAHDITNQNTKYILNKKKIHELSAIKDDINNCEINHISASPFNENVMFIYRSKGRDSISEIFCFSSKKNKLRKIFSGHIASHYCWISASEILAYIGKKVRDQGYYLIEISDSNTNKITEKHNMNGYGDGHPSICPNNKFIVYDSYPDRNRYIHLNLYDIKTNEVIKIGRFFSPLKFSGYYRCDLHPRWSPDGNYISIDSSHSGLRKHYMIDVSNIVKKDIN